MTDEQAIENLRKILFTTMQANECGLSNNDFKTEIKTYTDILGLIERQQREKELHIKLEQQYKKEYLDAKEENKKKDMIIDLMSKYIARFDIEEDICLKVEDNCYDYAGQNGKLCEDCIKEYFKKKVEDK